MPNVKDCPIHFDDFSGEEFELLIVAYCFSVYENHSVEWRGQQGQDGGIDIWVEDREVERPKVIGFQCKNEKNLALKSLQESWTRVKKVYGKLPDEYRVVCGGAVSNKTRSEIKSMVQEDGVKCVVWSGAETEECLRNKTPLLLKRFCEGERFPETAGELRQFATQKTGLTDDELLGEFAKVFDRPAFRTHFKQECEIADFEKALTDTIEALNTGVRRLRDGIEICRIPNRHDLKCDDKKEGLNNIIGMLIDLRAKFCEYVSTREIRPCDCDNPSCHVICSSPGAAREMDRRRQQILDAFRVIYPKFSVHLLSR